MQSILESPHGVIFFSLDTAYRYTSFAKAHAQTMQSIWGATIEIGTCMLDVILDDADRRNGIIPICSYCKKVRTDEQSWQQLEASISAHSDALFSHGICPTCLVEHVEI